MTIQIEEGKYYRTRDGQRVGPVESHDRSGPYKFTVGDGEYLFLENGKSRRGSKIDLVEEVPAPTEDDGFVTRQPVIETADGPQIAETPEWAKQVEAEAAEEQVNRMVFGEAPDIKAVIADEAKRIVSGARRGAYGRPEDNFARIARYWDAYFKNTGRNIDITPADVSPLMRLVKEARLNETPDHYDSHVDLAGYTLTGAEVNGVSKPT